MRHNILIIVGIFSLIIFLSNCLPSVKTSSSIVLKTAEKHYTEFCASCHGEKMKNFVDRKWIYGKTKQDLIKSIKYGIEDAGMPAYDTSFTQVEIEALADYILKGIEEKDFLELQSKANSKYYTTKYQKLRVETIIDNIEVPWGIKVTADGTIFFTERKGTLKMRTPDGTITKIKNTPKVSDRNQGGMLDLALHPDFENNKLIYLSYSKINKEDEDLYTTAVLSAKLIGDELKELKEVFEALPYSSRRHHYGSRLVFDEEGFLYITVGDRGARDENPQSLSNSCGKIHRIYEDGRIPTDNPFYDQDGAVKSIWTYGNRNPQGLVYDEFTNTVWEHEHGPKGGDELNIVKKGANYGWPIVSYGVNYSGTRFTDLTEKEGVEPPLNYWTPSIAPSGMALVNGENYGKWKGDILTGSLRFDYISRVKIEGTKVVEEEKILEGLGRIRSIEMGADGFLYVGVEDPGRIVKIWALN